MGEGLLQPTFFLLLNLRIVNSILNRPPIVVYLIFKNTTIQITHVQYITYIVSCNKLLRAKIEQDYNEEEYRYKTKRPLFCREIDK